MPSFGHQVLCFGHNISHQQSQPLAPYKQWQTSGYLDIKWKLLVNLTAHKCNNLDLACNKNSFKWNLIFTDKFLSNKCIRTIYSFYLFIWHFMFNGLPSGQIFWVKCYRNAGLWKKSSSTLKFSPGTFISVDWYLIIDPPPPPFD